MKIPSEALIQQKIASDPALNIWVSANAGSGKTHVLTERVLRILLNGSNPSSILCLTYTKAAAAVMKQRVFARLLEWTRLDDEQLKHKIFLLEGKEPTVKQLKFARELFARALETPGGLKIQTIHSFCQAILHQFPIEADMPGFFKLDEDACFELQAAVKKEIIEKIQTYPESDLAKNIMFLLQKLKWSEVDKLLTGSVQNMHKFCADYQQKNWQKFFTTLQIKEGVSKEDYYKQFTQLIQSSEQKEFLNFLEKNGGNTTIGFIEKLRAAIKDDYANFVASIESAFYTANHQLRSEKNIIIKKIIDKDPDALAKFTKLREQSLVLVDQIVSLDVWQINQTIKQIFQEFLNLYSQKKQIYGLLSYQDLILKMLYILRRCDIGWVHCKLDQGIDHILVDEAQDTNPEQWEIIQHLSSEFFAGAGQKNIQRSIFAVGDEKQSIYSFQGADPVGFADNRRYFQKRIQNGKQEFREIRLHYSFRSTSSILQAVDCAFSNEKLYKGLSDDKQPTSHAAIRLGFAGEVDIWDYESSEKSEIVEDWCAENISPPKGEVKLAEKIAETISLWLNNKEFLPSKGRCIEAGDILILVRSRCMFVDALSKALKEKNIPLAGRDRLFLLNHIAIQDLLALTRFVLFSTDDLSLAGLLKSPLFALSEEQLFEVAHQREPGETLWQALQKSATHDPVMKIHVDRLAHYRSLADRVSVFEFYSRILDQDEGRKKYFAALGEQVNEIFDLFLNYVLNHEKNNLPGLYIFMEYLLKINPEIKRELGIGMNVVRIMTIHGAKGLEAPVVFLIDQSSPHYKKDRNSDFYASDQSLDSLPVWINKSYRNRPCFNKIIEQEQSKQKNEYFRLLYVGMTRAEDRLILCGYKKNNSSDSSGWLSLVEEEIFKQELQEISYDLEGNLTARRFVGSQSITEDLSKSMPQEVVNSKQSLVDIPDFFYQKMPVEKNKKPYIAPSLLSQLNVQLSHLKKWTMSPILSRTVDNQVVAIERGLIVHSLLQYLPEIPLEEREIIAQKYVNNHLEWNDDDKAQLIQDVMKIFMDENLKFLWSKQSRAEVSIMADIEINGEMQSFSAIIDRLVETDDSVIIVDYKTGAVPYNSNSIPLPYILQLALYTEVLAPIYPNKSIICFLIYTQGPNIFKISEEKLKEILDSFQKKHVSDLLVEPIMI